jgi:hypothetical protein
LKGEITEPVISHSTKTVTMTRIVSASGSAGRARTAATACCPAAEIGSAGLASVISQVPGATATGPLARVIPGRSASRPA